MEVLFSFLIGLIGVAVGLGAWRREHVGRRKIEVAEEALTLFYEASDALRFMRNPTVLVTDDETELVRREGELDDAYDARRRASIVFVRHEQRREVFHKLFAQRYKLMALVGSEAGEPIEVIQRLVSQVLLSGQSLAHLWGRTNMPSSDEAIARHQNLIETYEASFWDGYTTEDAINTQLNNATTEIENICRNAIDGSRLKLRKPIIWII